MCLFSNVLDDPKEISYTLKYFPPPVCCYNFKRPTNILSTLDFLYPDFDETKYLKKISFSNRSDLVSFSQYSKTFSMTESLGLIETVTKKSENLTF